MTEPVYIAQTFEARHQRTQEDIRLWFNEAAADASRYGGKFARFTYIEGGKGLLIEVWDKPPRTMGKPRWQLEAVG